MDSTAPPSPPGPSRLRRHSRRLAVAVAALAVAWAAAYALANRAVVRERIRSRADELLRARLPEAALGDEAGVDWLLRATVGPLTVPASAAGAPPVLGVGRIKVRAAWLPLLVGRIEPASIRLEGVRLAPGPGGRELVRLIERLRARRSPAPTSGPAGGGADGLLELRGLTVSLELGSRSVELGPFDLRLARTRNGTSEILTAALALAGGGYAEATLRRPTEPIAPPGSSRATATGAAAPRVPPAIPSAPERGLFDGPWSLVAALDASPDDLPAFLRHRSVTATAGSASLSVEAEGSAGGAVASIRGRLDGLSLAGAPLGEVPVGPLNGQAEATLAFTRSNGRLTVDKAALRPAGPLLVQASGWLSTREDLAFALELDVPGVDYAALLAALPAALVPPLQAPRPPGKVGGSLALSGALRGTGPWTLQAEVDLSGLREAARHGPPSPLRSSFSARLGGEDGPPVPIGPESPSFVPLAELPQVVVRAITTSEDAGFFGHRGFDFEELRKALADGALAGRLRRGGSTITQQLAKNLYLSRDRTLARKAKEALITMALEGTVPKARLLEIYLNLIEWGPGLHGIGPAARHYLDKDARALTPREACFLATLIPSPRRSHDALAGGVPVERWRDRVEDLLRKLAAVGLLDDEALARELEAPIHLAAWVPRPSGDATPGDPPAADPEEVEGDGGPEPAKAAPGTGTAASTSATDPARAGNPEPPPLPDPLPR